MLSLLVFNLYSEIFKEALLDVAEWGAVNGELLNNKRYADDTVIFADNLQGPQQLMNSVTTRNEKYGLKIRQI